MTSPGRRTSFADSMKSAFSNFDPKAVTSELNRGFHQAIQYAGEKLGTAEVTPLPQEYLDLEARMDRLRAIHENLIKIAALQVHPGATTDIRFTVYGAINNVADSLGTPQDQSLSSVNERLRSVTVDTHSSNQVMADEFTSAAMAAGDDTPLGSALLKSADAQRRIGRARTKMNTEVNERFIKRLTQNLEHSIRNVNQGRRAVNACRLRLDALKSRVKSSSPEKAELMTDELQELQDEFSALLSNTLSLMKSAVETTEPLAALADMMASMLTYFQTGFELLSELAPELDSMKVAQEALSDKTSSPTSPSFPPPSSSSTSSSSSPSPSTTAV